LPALPTVVHNLSIEHQHQFQVANLKLIAHNTSNSKYGEDCDGPGGAAQIGPQDLIGKTAAEIHQLAKDRGLVPHPTKPTKWMDPVTGKERLRIDPGHIDKQTGLPYNDPKAAVPYHHGYGPDGKRKIVDPSDGNPHFPTAPSN